MEFLTAELVAALGIVLGCISIAVAMLTWRFPRGRLSTSQIQSLLDLSLHRVRESPVIHSINGVPTFQQLTQGLVLNAKRRGLARRMYALGLEQFNHYSNNRDGIISEARDTMSNLQGQLSKAEISVANQVGVALVKCQKDILRVVRTQYEELSPQGQTYATCRRDEYKALQTIARDQEKGISRTDFGSVKSRIAEGNVPLVSITGELPIMWQDLMTLGERVESIETIGKPPKQQYVHILFLTRDGRVLEDKKAERDDKWLKSRKHRLVVPYQEPAEVYELVEPGMAPVPTGKRMVILDRNAGTEWTTELWRQGGYMDQQYLFHRDGQAPEQLRTSYRRRRIGRFAWTLVTGLLILDAAILVARYIE